MTAKLLTLFGVVLLIAAMPTALAANGDGVVNSFKPDVASVNTPVTLKIQFTNDATDGSCLDELIITAPDTWGGLADVTLYDRGSLVTEENKADLNCVNLQDDDQSVRIIPAQPICPGETVNIEVSGLTAPGDYEVSEIEIWTSDEQGGSPSCVRAEIDENPVVYVTNARNLELEYFHISAFSSSGFQGRAWGAWARLDQLHIDSGAGGNLEIWMETGSTDTSIFNGAVSGVQTLNMDYSGWDTTDNGANLKNGYIKDQTTRAYYIVYSGSTIELLGSEDEILDDEKLTESGLAGAKGTIITAGTSEQRKILVQLTDANGYDVNEAIPLHAETDLGQIVSLPPYMTDSDGNAYFTLVPDCDAGLANVRIYTDPLADDDEVTEVVGINAGSAYSYEVTKGDGADVPVMGTQEIEVTVYDQCENVITNTNPVRVFFDYTGLCAVKNKLAQSPSDPSHDHEEEDTDMGIALVYLVADCELCAHEVDILVNGIGGETIDLQTVVGPPVKMQVTIDEAQIMADECIDALIEVTDECGNRIVEIIDEGGQVQEWESLVGVYLQKPLVVDQPGWTDSSQTHITSSDFREEDNRGDSLLGKLNDGAGTVEICGCQGLGVFDVVAKSDTRDPGSDSVSVVNALPDCIETTISDEQLLLCEKETTVDVAIKDECGNYMTNQDCLGGPTMECVELSLTGGESEYGCEAGDAHLSTKVVCIDVGLEGPGQVEIPVTLFRDTDDCCVLELIATESEGCCDQSWDLEQCEVNELWLHGAPAEITTRFESVNPANKWLVDQYKQIVSEEVRDVFEVWDACGHIVKDFDGTVDIELVGEDCVSYIEVDSAQDATGGHCQNPPTGGDGCSEIDDKEDCIGRQCEWVGCSLDEDVVDKIVIDNCADEVKRWTDLEEEDIVVDKLAFKVDAPSYPNDVWVYIYAETEVTPGFQAYEDHLIAMAPMQPITIAELGDYPWFHFDPEWLFRGWFGDDQRDGGWLVKAGDSQDFYVTIVDSMGNLECGHYDVDFLWYQDYNSPDITDYQTASANYDYELETTAAIDGLTCLMNEQYASGGWGWGTEYDEVTGEATVAVAWYGQYQSMIDGADRLLENQNTDGGWGWPTGDPSTTNTLGVTAMGVLEAYKATGNPVYMEALEDAYEYALATEPTYTGSSETTKGVDSCPDITWLVEMSKVTGDDKYADLAKQRYDNRMAAYGGAGAFAVFLRDLRAPTYPGLVAWDIDLCVKAAKALNQYYGDIEYSEDKYEMTGVLYDAMYGTTVYFDPDNDCQAEYILGLAGAIDTFRVTDIGKDRMDDLIDKLLAKQAVDGCWGTQDAQYTAYVIRELAQLAHVEDWFVDVDNYNYISGSRNDDYTNGYGFGDRKMYNLQFYEGTAWLTFRDLTAEVVDLYVKNLIPQGDICGYTEDIPIEPNPETIEFISQPATQVVMINHNLSDEKTADCGDEIDALSNGFHINLQTADGFQNDHAKEVEVELDYCLKWPFGDMEIEAAIDGFCMYHPWSDLCEPGYMDNDRCFTREDYKEFLADTEFGEYWGDVLFGDFFGSEFSEWVDSFFENAEVVYYDKYGVKLLYNSRGKQVVMTDSLGQAEVYATSPTAGVYKLKATPLALDADFTFARFVPGAAASLDIMALPAFGVPADGEEEAMLLLRALDACGNAVWNPVYDVTVTAGGEQVYISQDFDGNNNYDNEVTGTLYSGGFFGNSMLRVLSDLPQTSTITASAPSLGEEGDDSTSIAFQGAPVQLKIVEITPSDRIPADGQTGAWVTVQVQDRNGNRVTGYLGDGFSGDPADPWGFTDYTFESICVDLSDMNAFIPLYGPFHPNSLTYGWINFHQVGPNSYCGDLMFGQGRFYVVYGNQDCNHGGNVDVDVYDMCPFQGQEINENGLPYSVHATQLDPDSGEIEFVDPATQWNIWSDKQLVLADGKSKATISVQVENDVMDVRQAVEGNVYVGGTAESGAVISWNGDTDELNPTSMRIVTDPVTGKAVLELTSTEPGIAEVTIVGGDAYVCERWYEDAVLCESTDDCVILKKKFCCHYSSRYDLTAKTITVEFLEVANNEIYLEAGWNFVSVPYALEYDTVGEVFDLEFGEAAYGWDANTQSWDLLMNSDTIEPLEGYWVKKNAPMVAELVYSEPAFPSIPTKTVKAGWNAVGLTWDSPMVVKNALISIQSVWSQLIGWVASVQGYDLPVANVDGNGPMEAGGASMQPKAGYWIWVTDDAPMAGIAALGG